MEFEIDVERFISDLPSQVQQARWQLFSGNFNGLEFRLNFSSFVFPNTLSRSARCRLVSVSIFPALACSTDRVDLLVVVLSRQSGQSVSTFRALCWNLDSFCLLFSCLWRLSKYSYFRRTGSCKLMFHSPKVLSIRPFSHRFEFGFCLAALWGRLYKTLNQGQNSDAAHEERGWCICINK